ncbi:MAG: AraC family transcriptional regulator [Terrimicrobiaceae bacterium]|nr:AraC family transcriptional regulator [Terrimicrobiaceae bacterium]
MARREGFSEAGVWAGVDGNWRRVFGDFAASGVSVEWHDFSVNQPLEWQTSIHPESLEICVNFEGGGSFLEGRRELVFEAGMVAWYAERDVFKARREKAARHRFLTIEMTRAWLAAAMGPAADVCSADLRRFLERGEGAKPRIVRLGESVRRAAEEMIRPPVPKSLQAVWYSAKIVEVAVHVFAPPVDDLFCDRQKLLARDRVEAVKRILNRDLENPPALQEIAREVGCSPFYLSRIFSEETGTTISRWLRGARLDLAAARLRSGKFNVTEAAMSVGYSSLSHFSKAFAGRFGHCPCVFPLQRDEEK